MNDSFTCRRFGKNIIAILTVMILSASCNRIDDDRIPLLPVNIDLSNPGLWNTYGVAGIGINRQFILSVSPNIRIPANFPYKGSSATGFGGVLLIGGMDPFTNDPNVPLAYDLACPYCRNNQIRVHVDSDTMEAVCDNCDSHYNVVMSGGTPISGPALTKRYAMRRYDCLPTSSGGYIITY